MTTYFEIEKQRKENFVHRECASLTTHIDHAAAELIGQQLGTSGLSIATRVMGLILAAMAVQFMADGMLELFPGLSR